MANLFDHRATDVGITVSKAEIHTLAFRWLEAD